MNHPFLFSWSLGTHIKANVVRVFAARMSMG